jgi:ATP phosphoribosyltransferase regulatory subunit
MPRRWRKRLAGLFWRADAFRAELARLSTTPGSNAAHLPRDLMDALAATHDTPTAAADAVAIVLGHLDERRLETFGARPVEDVAASLAALARDAVARPLAPEATAAIERYIAIGGTLAGLPEALRALAAEMNLDIARAIASTEQRNAALERAGIDPGGVAYSGEFGRALAYYTGFVFEIGLPEAPRTSPIAGGGRYDRLMATCGAPADVPAVGAAIHTERLLVALAGGGA